MAPTEPDPHKTKFDLVFFATCIRFLSLASGIGMIIMAGLGFDVGVDMVQATDANTNAIDGYSFGELGAFLAAMSIYFIVFGSLLVFAESRLSFMRRFLKLYFGFLMTFFGRGMFYIFLGSILALVGHAFAKTIAAVLIICGVCQSLFSCCPQLKTESGDMTPEEVESMNPARGARGGNGGAGRAERVAAANRARQESESDVFSKAAREEAADRAGHDATDADFEVTVEDKSSRHDVFGAGARRPTEPAASPAPAAGGGGGDSDDEAANMFGGGGGGGDGARRPSL